MARHTPQLVAGMDRNTQVGLPRRLKSMRTWFVCARKSGSEPRLLFYLNERIFRVSLVMMTRLLKSKPSTSKGSKGRPQKGRSGYWLLQDAKARFSELVRKVRSEGPQHVTVHGRDEVVVIAAEEFRRLKGSATGQALIEAMQASPHRDIEIAPRRGTMPVRDVSL